MSHTASNRRLAKRLGVTLEDADVISISDEAEGLWTTDGHDTVYDGSGKAERRISRRPSDGTWSVQIGRYTFVEGVKLDTAMTVSRFLDRRSNRRAWRGLAPKERMVAVQAAAEGSQQTLAEYLQSVNGGAVRVTA